MLRPTALLTPTAAVVSDLCQAVQRPEQGHDGLLLSVKAVTEALHLDSFSAESRVSSVRTRLQCRCTECADLRMIPPYTESAPHVYLLQERAICSLTKQKERMSLI